MNSTTQAPTEQPFKINTPRRMSMGDIIKQQNQDRGLEPLPLEPELLLKRIADGGHSGEFLGDAFLSAYRPDWQFHYSLFDLIKLDAEGFRLFHQILHIRFIPGWNDDTLYQVEQQILAMLRGGCAMNAFKHRVDGIIPALERAAAVADLIEGAYEVIGSDGFDANTLWRAAQAIRFEILDAKELLKAYIDADQAVKPRA